MSAQEANDFLQKLTPDSFYQELLGEPVPHDHFLGMNITINELNLNIKTGGDTAPGLDGITYSMIEHLPKQAKEQLCLAFNKILKHGDDCDTLKNVLIKPINKPGKINEFRPISLMSCILKTLERIIKIRLEWWTETYNTLPLSQFGFRRGKGVTDCIAHLTLDIQQCFNDNNYLGAFFWIYQVHMIMFV